MPYSKEFREVVMEYVDGFHSQAYVAKLFKISAKTVWNWVNQRKEVGHLHPKKSSERSPRKLEKRGIFRWFKSRLYQIPSSISYCLPGSGCHRACSRSHLDNPK
ncbi:MAG: IS630 transposase-related protein [Holosporaceae bacterium]|nr:IS630 transposase-related protein [Holosporaceae bacterium]